MSYRIKNGRIQTSLCELNVVHHCNLSCRSCSHLSDRVNKYFVDPDQVRRDFSLLAQYCHPQHVRLLGGEPLLHPYLLDVIDAVRDSGISECLRVVTNGILLHRMPDIFWQKVDQIHISLYPACRISPQQLRSFWQLARKYNTQLEVRYVNRFRESFSELGTRQTDLVKRIYSTCQIAHSWRCQAIFEGYFYRCSPSIMIPLGLQNQTKTTTEVDGLKLIHKSTFTKDLHKFLTTKEPLKACRHCLGSVGKRIAPTQRSYRDPITRFTTEELIDWKYLKYYELVGNRRVPNWLQTVAYPAKKALLYALGLVKSHAKRNTN